MIIEKHFFNGGCDSDTNPRLLPQNAMLNCMNARMSASEFGRTLRLENIPGTTKISQQVYPPYGTNQCIGSAIDESRSRMLYMIANSSGDHGIYCIDHSIPTAIKTYAVLYDSQVIGGLNFSKNIRINRNAKVVDGLLYWVEPDVENGQRRLNIDAGIKTNHASYVTSQAPYQYPMNPEVITIIRRPPNYTLSFQKKLASSLGIVINNNQIENNSFYFNYYFEYRDHERSTLSAWSLLAPYNFPNETFDLIQINLSLSQLIDQDVQKIVLVAIYADGTKGFEIKIWDKNNPQDLAEINAHNAGTQSLQYYFTNNDVGSAIDSATLVKPYDVVPRRSGALENADNRIFLGRNLVGYNSPVITSLVASVLQQTTGGGGSTITINGTLANVTYLAYQTRDLIDPESVNVWFVYFPTAIDATHPAGFYDLVAHPLGISRVIPIPPNPLNMADFVYVGADVTVDVMQYIPNYDYLFLGYIPFSRVYQSMYTEGLVTTQTTSSSFDTTNRTILKTGSSRKIAIVFYDKYMRQCGVVISATGLITIPNRGYSLSTTYSYAIQWALSNANALAEIPDWAYYYSIVCTKDLTRVFFAQSLYGGLAYVTKDQTTGRNLFSTFSYAAGSVVGIGVHLDILFSQGMGYVFSPGDEIILHDSLGLFNMTLSITGQDGDWLICQGKNIGALTGNTGIFEIYTPRPQAASEFYFEQGTLYNIVNPQTSSRQYSTTLGYIPGDVYLLNPNPAYGSTYITENMSPNLIYWQNWFTNAGREQSVDKIGEKYLETGIRWSNVIVEETVTNGLSSFDALDQKILPTQLGAIQNLQITTKVNNDIGIVMLAICYFETASMYIGQVQLLSADKDAFVGQSLAVIGTVNILKGSYGTQNPESVIEYLGLVFWLDIRNGVFVQYSPNGLEAVSRYKMERFFNNYSKDYLASSNNNLDNINGFHHTPTAFDPFHKEVLCTLPALIYENYATILPSYSSVPSYATSIVNRFDIYDKLGKTMAFKFEGNENKWGDDYEFMGEWYDYMQNAMFGFKNGDVYIHNSDILNWNTFYGKKYPIRICGIANANQSALKDLTNISIEGNVVPDFSVAMSNYPNVQITDLAATDWDNLEGNIYASWFRDRLSPNASGTPEQKLYTGDQLTDIAIYWMCEFQQNSSLAYINFINIGYELSKGQQQIANASNK